MINKNKLKMIYGSDLEIFDITEEVFVYEVKSKGILFNCNGEVLCEGLESTDRVIVYKGDAISAIRYSRNVTGYGNRMHTVVIIKNNGEIIKSYRDEDVSDLESRNTVLVTMSRVKFENECLSVPVLTLCKSGEMFGVTNKTLKSFKSGLGKTYNGDGKELNIDVADSSDNVTETKVNSYSLYSFLGNEDGKTLVGEIEDERYRVKYGILNSCNRIMFQMLYFGNRISLNEKEYSFKSSENTEHEIRMKKNGLTITMTINIHNGILSIKNKVKGGYMAFYNKTREIEDEVMTEKISLQVYMMGRVESTEVDIMELRLEESMLKISIKDLNGNLERTRIV